MLTALVCAGGCKNNQSTDDGSRRELFADVGGDFAVSVSLSPEDLGTLGAQIKKQPNAADSLLAAHGMNVQSFAAAVRKVSENPADAKRYTAAYKRAS